MIALASFLTSRLLGAPTAVLGGAIVALDPFLLAHSQVYVVTDKKVTGYTQDPLAMHRFDNVDVTE